MRIAVTGITAAIACLGALMLAGCGKKLDTDKIERGVEQGLMDRTGTKIASVTCPDDVEAKEGDTFRCTAKASSGESLQIEVVQEDDEGHVRWQLVRRP
jgi:uncharacterized protein DUF4333